MLQVKANWRTMSLYIITGTIYGATWAVILLLVSAMWQTYSSGAAWPESTLTSRTSIGLWFGALGGMLAGLIAGVSRLNIDVDAVSWATLVGLLGIMAISATAVIGLYSSVLGNVAGWLTTADFGQLQNGGLRFVAVDMVWLMVLPALFAVYWLHHSKTQAS